MSGCSAHPSPSVLDQPPRASGVGLVVTPRSGRCPRPRVGGRRRSCTYGVGRSSILGRSAPCRNTPSWRGRQAARQRLRVSVAEVLHCIRRPVEVWPIASEGLQNAPGCTPSWTAGAGAGAGAGGGSRYGNRYGNRYGCWGRSGCGCRGRTWCGCGWRCDTGWQRLVRASRQNADHCVLLGLK